MKLQNIQYNPRKSAYHEGRHDDPRGSKGRYDPFLPQQVIDVDLKGPGKKQEAEHSMQEQVIEVDTLDDPLGGCLHPHVQGAESYKTEGHNQPAKHQSYRGGQAKEAMIQVAEECSQSYQYCNNIDKVHSIA